MPPSAALRALLASQQGRGVLWLPVALMPGIALYFSLPSEPSLLWSAAFLLPLLALLLRRKAPERALYVALLLMALGFSLSQWRIHSLYTPQLTKEHRFVTVEGRITLIEPAEEKQRITLEDPVIEGLTPEETPHRIRLSLRQDAAGLMPGQRIEVLATLYPPPSATHPGGYDFARHFYVMGIGGNGYTLGSPRIIEPTAKEDAASISQLRQRIENRFMQDLPAPASAIAAAMTIGEAGAIPEPVKASLRDSGLYHILSISGLHLSLLSGLVFALVRLLLTLWPALALRIDAKKIAASAAFLASAGYLALAGYPVPAQRAFLMVALVLTAIVFDRRAITLRNLALAAFLILILMPEMLISASFQMSFAATLGIVALYETFRASLSGGGTAASRLCRYVLGILLTSLAASLATAPFVIYHFNRLSLLSVLANMVSLPITGFLIMPGLISFLALMPLDSQWLAYPVLEAGLAALLWISDTVAAMPAAAISLPAMTPWALLLAACGLIWLCLLRGQVRLVGGAMVLLACASVITSRPVDLFIGSAAQQVIIRLDSGEYAAIRGTSRSFSIENWLHSQGKEDLAPKAETALDCENDICRVSWPQADLVIVTSDKNTEALDEACRMAPDILIAPRYLNSQRCPQPRQLIGKRELESFGPHSLRRTEEGIEIEKVYGQQARLWHPRLRQP